MTIANVKQMVDCELEGRMRNYQWRKTPSQATTARLWFDLSMSPGNPPPKYWFDAPPGVAKAVSQSTDGGLFHGANVAPSQKYIRRITTLTTTVTALPMPILLCDYLLYYPSIDDSVTDPQVLDNTVTLPRYTDGEGVQILAVSVAGRTGGKQFNVSYTNSAGVAGRTSQTVTQNAAAAIGTVVTSATATQASGNPFIGLQSGDTGVRSIESVTMLGGDVGLFALILVKPLLQTGIKEITAPYEKDMFIHASSLPEVKDDAYLSLLCIPNGTLAATALIGDLKVIWN
jgi:hypothetical protein